MSTVTILWSIFLSSFGMAYILYAKQQRKAVPLLGGIILVVLPYITLNTYILIGVLILIVLLSYFLNF